MLKEEKIRDSFDYYMTLADVKQVLNISYKEIISLIKSGELPATKMIGKPLSLEQINESTRGLRILPSDLKAYLDSRAV